MPKICTMCNGKGFFTEDSLDAGGDRATREVACPRCDDKPEARPWSFEEEDTRAATPLYRYVGSKGESSSRPPKSTGRKGGQR